MKKIIYLVQRFRSDREATSKEVNILFEYFRKKSTIHDLHLDGIFNFGFSKDYISYHFILYPLLFPFIYLLTRKRISHVYTSLTDSSYLPFLSKKRMILTSTNYFNSRRIKKRLRYLKKVRRMIIESEVQRKELLDLGVDPKKIELIYPPTELNRFGYKKAKGKFKILNASCPTTKVEESLGRRGVFLLFDADKHLKNIEINFLWRKGKDYKILRRMIKNRKFNVIKIRNEIIKDMNKEYAKHHCSIISYTRFDEYLKLIPLSAIESLAAGKPVLVSSQTGIASIVKKESCGVVFEPNVKSLIDAIAEIKKNYYEYQKNCRKTAEKYFSKEEFIRRYEQIYNEIG